MALITVGCALAALVTAPSTAASTTPSTTASTGSEAGARATGDDALLLVVDFSGSMLESDGAGSTRIAAAKTAVTEIVQALPADLPVGLRVYGHRTPSADKVAACQDTELVVPVSTLDRTRLVDTVNALEPLGETPIGLSLQQAARDFPAGSAGTLILVSDGADECFPDLGPEPCQVTKDLIAEGLDLRVETIGLQVASGGADQLRCMAAAGGGEFTSVADAGLLADAIIAARQRAQRTFQPRGEVVAGGPALIDATPLETGTYQDSIFQGETLWYAAEAARGQTVTARLTVRTTGVPATGTVDLRWQDGNADLVATESLAALRPGQANTLAVATGTVDGSRSPLGGTRDPGTYYLSATIGGFPPDVAHDYVLEIIADDPSSVAGASTPAIAPSSTPGAVAPSPGAVALPDPPSEGASGVTIAFIVTLVALAAAGYLFLRRRRRRDEATPPAPTYY